MILVCDFIFHTFVTETLYMCKVNVGDSTKTRGNEILGVFGDHLPGFKNADVKAIWFADVLFNYLPKGISRIFPNLEAVVIIGCDLLEILTGDLEDFTNLKYLYIHSNKITKVPVDLFKGMSKLQEISIIDNKKLRSGISSQLFKPVIKNGLKYVDLSNNQSVNAFFCPGIEGTLASVQELMEAIDGISHIAVERCNESTVEEDNDSRTIPDKTFEAPKESGEIFEKPNNVDCKKASLNFKELWETKDGCDCLFNAGLEEIGVHKRLLAEKSPVFKEMFEQEIDKNCVVFSGYSSECIQEYLRFLYTNHHPSPAKAREVLKIAMKTKVFELVSVCENIIEKFIDKYNVISIYALGYRYNLERTSEVAKEYLTKMFPGKEQKLKMEHDLKKIEQELDKKKSRR